MKDQHKEVCKMEVIVTNLTRRGNGKNDPIRIIREIWTLDGEKIAEYDCVLPH